MPKLIKRASMTSKVLVNKREYTPAMKKASFETGWLQGREDYKMRRYRPPPLSPQSSPLDTSRYTGYVEGYNYKTPTMAAAYKKNSPFL